MTEQSSYVAVVNWFVELATGRLAIITATIAVAAVGIMMMDGRLDWQRATRVLLGCFVLFGASTIASAFLGFGEASYASSSHVSASAGAPIIPSADDDPWAHAALSPAASPEP